MENDGNVIISSKLRNIYPLTIIHEQYSKICLLSGFWGFGVLGF